MDAGCTLLNVVDKMAQKKRRLQRRPIQPLAVFLAALSASCAGAQSALDPAGREAAKIFDIFRWMTVIGLFIWLVVIALFLWCARTEPDRFTQRTRMRMIVGGAITPMIVLGGLLIFTLQALPKFAAPAPEASLRIVVSGEQWWWRVRYSQPNRNSIILANEIRLPVGEPVEFQLDSPDVVHSFWIPSLGGKMDMIPGRVTRLVLTPLRTGTFRGVCAEYCGASHALMRFAVVVLDEDDFERWLSEQAKPALHPADPLAVRGQELFLASGCGACHAVRGTSADGVVGPDLTHVGGRLTLASDALPNEAGAIRQWIAHTQSVKPGALMPPFHMLPSEDLDAMAAYLEGLQ